MAGAVPPNDPVFLSSGRADFECASCGYWAVLAGECAACPQCGSAALVPLARMEPRAGDR
jgi:Zn finger protein HypA/HybF involved in hydrogenase expression